MPSPGARARAPGGAARARPPPVPLKDPRHPLPLGAGGEALGPRRAGLDRQPCEKRLVPASARREPDLLEDRDGLGACVPEQTVMQLAQRAATDGQAVGRGGGVSRGGHIARQLRGLRVRGARVPPRRSAARRTPSPSRASRRRRRPPPPPWYSAIRRR